MSDIQILIFSVTVTIVITSHPFVSEKASFPASFTYYQLCRYLIIVLQYYTLYFIIMVIKLTKSFRISEQTYENLSKRGTVADTFNDVIQELLKKERSELKEVKV